MAKVSRRITTRSLGFRISQGLAEQLGGKLTYEASNGTFVRLVFPTVASAALTPTQ